MKAYVGDNGQQSGVRLTDVPDPTPTPNEAMIEVEAFSLNSGELPGRVFRDASVPGWDSAGRIVTAAADGSRPGTGTRVVGAAWGGAWAEPRAVATDSLAPLPDGLDADVASTLPTAGITALRASGNWALSSGGVCSGRARRAASAASRCDLAHLAGADVVALTSSEARREELCAVGAGEVVTDLERLSPVYGVIETIGGSTLVDAWTRVAQGGILISIGYARGSAAAFPPFATVASGKSLVAMGNAWTSLLPEETMAAEVVYLARLGAARALDPQITWRGSWKQLPDAIALLQARQISGKEVLRVE